MTINKIITTVVFIVFTTATNGQELIQAGKYDDLMSAPKIAIAGGGTLLDWANMNFYKDSNERLKKLLIRIAWCLWVIQLHRVGVILMQVFLKITHLLIGV